MGDNSHIEWTDATWNPVTGCTKVSPGCDHCYAESIARRFAGTKAYPNGFDVTLRPERLDIPLRWRKPRRVFVNSMSDLFHKDIPDEYIARVFAVMSLAPQHTFQVLTKRHARMRSLLSDEGFPQAVTDALLREPMFCRHDNTWPVPDGGLPWPLPNVWLGVSVENQQWADIRIPTLLDTPAAVRFLSCEPLLGPVDLTDALLVQGDYEYHERSEVGLPAIDWVIVGGESGPGARPMAPAWAQTIRDQCVAAGVPFLFKQWGSWVTEDQSPEDITLPGTSWSPSGDDGPRVYNVGKRKAGRELDGRTWDEYPVVTDA